MSEHAFIWFMVPVLYLYIYIERRTRDVIEGVWEQDWGDGGWAIARVNRSSSLMQTSFSSKSYSSALKRYVIYTRRVRSLRPNPGWLPKARVVSSLSTADRCELAKKSHLYNNVKFRKEKSQQSIKTIFVARRFCLFFSFFLIYFRKCILQNVIYIRCVIR